jgi:5-methyltetrahydropteroyltriglutamate--homocysteine methyltransferase
MAIGQLIGYPRIGPRRELKWALERAWAGRTTSEELLAETADLRRAHIDEQRGLIGSAADDFFLYDEVLETALMLGIVPDEMRATLATDPFGVLTALARGTPQLEAWEMTKWFDTNYHFVVPELARGVERLSPLPWRSPFPEADVSWVVLGPYSLLKLAKATGDAEVADVADAAAAAYWRFAREQADRDARFRLQLDEPCLGLLMSPADERLRDAVYAGVEDLGLVAPPLVTVQFGEPSAATMTALGRAGFAVQVPLALAQHFAQTEAWRAQPEHVIGVMDGRSVWPDDFGAVRRALAALSDDGRTVRLVPSTSLMFLPYTVQGEELPAGFQFAREKAAALAAWVAALEGGPEPQTQWPPGAEWSDPGELQARPPRRDRLQAQEDLDLPPYPTTSTGSLPQTAEVRQLRVRLGKGEIDRTEYEREVGRLIADAIAWQEAKGIDVLVHGEFERTDMVEYFAAQMHGYFTTRNGWVLSYGSRCTRPPILAAPPYADGPMTVREWQIAQSATRRPVKGMLTGPVTIVNWSFRPPGVPDDRLFWAVAQPIAAEVGRLVEAGARVVQVDEPAVRERWPLPTVHAEREREIYARGVRAALNHVFNQPPHVQMHTHMCYGDFGDIVPLWADAGVDVASIEFSRSKDDSYIRQFYELFDDGHLKIGPGVFDVHSPHSPGRETMTQRLDHFRTFMDDVDLWVNPDCGLKTRRWEEIDRQLTDMVAAARALRAAVAVGAARDGD